LPEIGGGGAWVRNRSAEVFPKVRNWVWRAVREVRNPDADPFTDLSLYHPPYDSQLRMVRMIRIKTHWQGGFRLTALILSFSSFLAGEEGICQNPGQFKGISRQEDGFGVG